MSDSLINPFARGIPGNVNLHNRTPVPNPETGGTSTVWSMSFADDQGREILVPRVVGGQILSADEAIAHYRATGEHLGIFPDVASAEAYGRQLHDEQEREYLPRR